MNFRELLEMQINKPSKRNEPKYKELEADLKKLKDGDAHFSVLNDVRGKFTITYRIGSDDEKLVKKLADKGFKIIKGYYPKAKEVNSDFGRFPYEQGEYALEIEYKLGDK